MWLSQWYRASQWGSRRGSGRVQPGAGLAVITPADVPSPSVSGFSKCFGRGPFPEFIPIDDAERWNVVNRFTPPDWNDETAGRPDVVFLVYGPESKYED